MDKEKEIQEISSIIGEWAKKPVFKNPFVMTDVSNSLLADDLAITLYNRGYRNSDRVREETAKAILKEVGDEVTYYEGEGSVFYERKPEWYYELCKKFGYKAE